jgi:hypothetical protein
METNANFIRDEDVEEALTFLAETAESAAKAKAERIYLEEYRKTVKAKLMAEFDDKSGIVQERNAYADQRYIDHLSVIRDAVFEDERHRFMREAASARIEAWRSLSANYRAMKI